MLHIEIARRATSRAARPLVFLPALGRAQRRLLPETPAPASATRWRTVRIRPEVDTVLLALQARYRAAHGLDLSVSEIAAAALLEALPGLLAGDFNGQPEGDR